MEVRKKSRDASSNVGEFATLTDLGAFQRLVQALARDQVEAGGQRRGDGLVCGCGQLLDHLGTDQTRAADDCELHVSFLSSACHAGTGGAAAGTGRSRSG
jgi:hypothetical protein